MLEKYFLIIEICLLFFANGQLYSGEKYSAESYENNLNENSKNYAQESYQNEPSEEYHGSMYQTGSYETKHEAECQQSDHLTPVEGHCYKFRMCANGILTIMECPIDLVFDSNLRICNRRENVGGKCGHVQSENY